MTEQVELPQEELPQPNFDTQKKEYFFNLGLKVKKAFQVHKQAGLWEKKDGKRDWGNVTEHCLVEVARVEVLSDMLGISDVAKQELMIGAALHDVNKKNEKTKMVNAANSGESVWDAYHQAAIESNALLQAASFNEREIKYAGSPGPESLKDIQDILEKENLEETDIAFLVIHYVDDITKDSDWIEPVNPDENGQLRTTLDVRLDESKIASNHYAKFNQEGRAHFKNRTVWQEELRVGHLVENRLAQEISNRSNSSIVPHNIPQLIDGKIKEKIALVAGAGRLRS